MGFDDTVFLTGFPGFISGRLIEKLAAAGSRLLLLVQPALRDRARREVNDLVERLGIATSHFHLIEGDITLPNLGMSAADSARAVAETNVIFHLAAVYDLAVPREIALKVNVEGTRQVNAFARALKDLRRYHYVSTCYVAGKRKGVIRETELDPEAGFRNYYEETKYLAEAEVAALIPQLPITIHRPAIVCGDSRTGETAKYDGMYPLMIYLLKSPRLLSIPNLGNRAVRLNLVPVDWLIESMMALAGDERSIGATVQLADPAPLTTEALFDALANAIGGHRSRFTVPAPIVYYSLMLPISPPITGLPRSAVPYFFLDQTYDTEISESLLTVRCPSFTSYVDRLVEYVKAHPNGP
ncbi:MAG: SDR family oxidoreductase [Pyrinomonadaceae bacterium]